MGRFQPKVSYVPGGVAKWVLLLAVACGAAPTATQSPPAAQVATPTPDARSAATPSPTAALPPRLPSPLSSDRLFNCVQVALPPSWTG